MMTTKHKNTVAKFFAVAIMALLLGCGGAAQQEGAKAEGGRVVGPDGQAVITKQAREDFDAVVAKYNEALKDGFSKEECGRVAGAFDDVADDHAMVLDHVNLKAHPGEVVALVGMSGGGKTTLVNLLPRFYDVTAGAIRIDDIDIRDASIESLRQQIAIVTQEPILFNDTVRANITYGNPGASKESIEKAARDAYAYDFIQGFPKGFETTIGELGSRLSGGEKQRICIARALLKDAPILILDEATSALDTEAEIVVQKALENLMKGRTTFVIAHRLSTITHANRILVLVKGRIVEEGTHDDLLARDGAYRKLYHMQFGKS